MALLSIVGPGKTRAYLFIFTGIFIGLFNASISRADDVLFRTVDHQVVKVPRSTAERFTSIQSKLDGPIVEINCPQCTKSNLVWIILQHASMNGCEKERALSNVRLNSFKSFQQIYPFLALSDFLYPEAWF